MNECSCVDVDLDETYHKIVKSTVTAQTNIKCCECQNVIKYGDPYEYFIGKMCGELHYYPTCLDCVSIRDTFFCNGWYYGMVIENLEEHISDCYGDIPSDCITPLTKGAKDRVCDLIEECWDEEE